MRTRQTNAINTSATRKQVRESSDRELTKEELDQTVGGLSLNFTKVQVEYWRKHTRRSVHALQLPSSRMEELRMTTTTNPGAASEQVREPTSELTEDELAHVSGGIIAILIGLLLPPSKSPSKDVLMSP